MELNEYVSAEALAELKLLLPDASLEPSIHKQELSNEVVVSIDLPAPQSAEYSYRLFFQPEIQIHACLFDVDEPELCFWYTSFEEAAYSGSKDKLDKAFLDTVRLLVSHETRITQKHSLFFESFRCEYRKDNSWIQVDSVSMFRPGGFRVPKITTRTHTYHCQSLIAGN